MKYFSIFWPIKNYVDLNMSLENTSDFVAFPLLGFTLVIKQRNFDFESHRNALTFFDIKRFGVRFEYVPWKKFDFASFLFFVFTLVIKLWNFDFESHRNTLIFLIKMPDLIMPCETVSDLVYTSLFDSNFGNKFRNNNFKFH